MTDQPFHEPTFLAALDRAEAMVIVNPDQYKPEMRSKAMRDLYASMAMVTGHNPLDREITRLSIKLDKLLHLDDEGKVQSAWDTTLARYERMCEHQWRVQEVMRRDREL